MIKLGSRLEMTANMVRDDAFIADIGTDHAYLPAWLLHKGKIKGALACDLREKPLENARQTLVKYNMENEITLVLSNGLDELEPNCANDIVIAGMGGLLIVNILSRCDWIKNKEINLIIQPMTHIENVREYLYENGFKIIKEDATKDSGKLYVAINARFSGENNCKYPLSFYYIGKLNESKSDYAKEFLNSQIRRLKKRADPLFNIDKDSYEAKELYTIIRDIERCFENGNS